MYVFKILRGTEDVQLSEKVRKIIIGI